MPQEVTLTLTVDEANLVLESLGGQPFVRVHDLVYKIRAQARAQVQTGDQQVSPNRDPQLQPS